MKNKITKLLALSGILATASVFAQTSVDRSDRVQGSTLREQAWGLTPQLGVMAYTDAAGADSARGAIGIGFDWNAAPLMQRSEASDLYLGVTTGVLYSHPGSPSSNFIGSDSSSSSSNANTLIMPANLKIGYNATDAFRMSAHGGGNVIYRSIASSMALGDGSDSGSALWKIFPNAGANFEFQVGRNLSINANPDFTFTPGRNIFVATLGATFIGY